MEIDGVSGDNIRGCPCAEKKTRSITNTQRTTDPLVTSGSQHKWASTMDHQVIFWLDHGDFAGFRVTFHILASDMIPLRGRNGMGVSVEVEIGWRAIPVSWTNLKVKADEASSTAQYKT